MMNYDLLLVNDKYSLINFKLYVQRITISFTKVRRYALLFIDCFWFDRCFIFNINKYIEINVLINILNIFMSNNI